jgi:hypothetical protein
MRVYIVLLQRTGSRHVQLKFFEHQAPADLENFVDVEMDDRILPKCS